MPSVCGVIWFMFSGVGGNFVLYDRINFSSEGFWRCCSTFGIFDVVRQLISAYLSYNIGHTADCPHAEKRRVNYIRCLPHLKKYPVTLGFCVLVLYPGRKGCHWTNEWEQLLWKGHANCVIILILMYLLTAIELSPGGSSTVHIYTQTIHGTTHITTEQHKQQLIWKSADRAPSLSFYTFFWFESRYMSSVRNVSTVRNTRRWAKSRNPVMRCQYFIIYRCGYRCCCWFFFGCVRRIAKSDLVENMYFRMGKTQLQRTDFCEIWCLSIFLIHVENMHVLCQLVRIAAILRDGLFTFMIIFC